MSEAAGLPQRLFCALADGDWHSGEQLAAALGVTRSAIWKSVAQLQQLGMEIESAKRRGYRARAAHVPLDAERIRQLLTGDAQRRLRRLSVAWSLPSTNSTLMALADAATEVCDVQLAEHQSAGRGRRARHWFAPPGGAICLSLSWSFAGLPADAGALSLAVGVAALRALTSLAPIPVRLKWPNDLVVGGAKLGGILIELRAEAAGPAQVVIGIGINVALGESLMAQVRATGAEPVDLHTLGLPRCDRNLLVARLLDELVRTLEEFARAGFGRFADDWRAADALRGRQIEILATGGTVRGLACGIDADGALRVQTASGMQRFVSGEVSVRAQS